MAPAIRPETGESTRFKPGQSGNPSGRPKGIAAKAREIIGDDPTELLEVFLEIAHNPAEKAADRKAAAEALLDRAYGKSPSYAPVDGDPLELDSLDRAIGTIVDDLAQRRKAPPPSPAPEQPVAGTG